MRLRQLLLSDSRAGSLAAVALCAGCAVSLSSLVAPLRARWDAALAGGPLCADHAQCLELWRELDAVHEKVCGASSPCPEMKFEQEMRQAIREPFVDRCLKGSAESCVQSAASFGYEPGFRAACDLGEPEACKRACLSSSDAGARSAADECGKLARQQHELLPKCKWKRQDSPQACYSLGRLLELVSRGAEEEPPPAVDVGHLPLIHTPLMPGRPRSRYALDYLSRACTLGEARACRELCRLDLRADDNGPRPACNSVDPDSTPRTLLAQCEAGDAKECFDLGVLRTKMGFYERDPAGFYLSGAGRAAVFFLRACDLGHDEACDVAARYEKDVEGARVRLRCKRDCKGACIKPLLVRCQRLPADAKANCSRRVTDACQASPRVQVCDRGCD